MKNAVWGGSVAIVSCGLLIGKGGGTPLSKVACLGTQTAGGSFTPLRDPPMNNHPRPLQQPPHNKKIQNPPKTYKEKTNSFFQTLCGGGGSSGGRRGGGGRPPHHSSPLASICTDSWWGPDDSVFGYGNKPWLGHLQFFKTPQTTRVVGSLLSFSPMFLGPNIRNGAN